ncbi:probably inactive leucine-rich repeat receptor-like protein kinase At5g48380 [Cynara cardunculus var. scolymus]|uniref:probably inactive leucine-rich repeat receptor-like protein kinase At5g48380 n=1 Tax=Cynara cardunculus var. scolymus TaxID=59895 RepID=UPI000D625C62|nr:probably inactive leucine-rich repeat receptor-like protein kinase At5g48380 [Cynara cardunculus var. scolymus]
MAPSNKAITVTCIWMLICIAISNAVESDINCLRSFKDSVQDPENALSTWEFNNRTEGFICRFTGVDCWHPDESKVLNIRLQDMGLKGTFPLGLLNCTSMTGLDLSSNHLSGTLPANISDIISLVTTLDLSSNNFFGPIPMMLSNCTYLNSLILDNNHFSGQISLELGQLTRLKEFRVANNLFSGPIPTFRNATIELNYGGNLGLCGGSLGACSESKKNRMGVIVVVAIIGGTTLATFLVSLGMMIFMTKVVRKRKVDDPDGNKCAKSIKGAETIKLSMFENPVSNMRLSDLMKATNSFSKENIIGSGRTGCLYKAVLEDGSSLMIKRLQDSKHSEKGFQSEMAMLGKVKHRNLVPLFGFCVAKRERLLVYKYMANGNLHDKLLPVGDDEKRLDWPSRLKIGIGAAKGFAWVHHNCNPHMLHRNISSKCIFLDADFEPRISDIGLARLMNPVDTHFNNFVNGEFGDLGYVAPEYVRTLVATPKGDVYSFGVVLLELVTGERPTHVAKAPETFKGNLAEWVTELAAESRLRDSIDESLAVEKDYENEMFQLLKVASRCVVPAHKERPSMFEVYQLLRAIGEHYHFTMDDEVLMMPSDDGGDAGQIELIVARDGKK